MAPDYVRKGSNYVYVFPDDSATYTYKEAAEYCVDNHGTSLPSIHSKMEAQNMGMYSAEQFCKLRHATKYTSVLTSLFIFQIMVLNSVNLT